MNLGGTELAIILVIALLVFGGSKIPDLARSLGAAKKEFEDGISEGRPADATPVDTPQAPTVDDEQPGPDQG